MGTGEWDCGELGNGEFGFFQGFNLPYYTKEKLLTKEHIFSQLKDDEELQKYMPTGVKLSFMARKILLSILAYIKKEKYLALYGIYKATNLQRFITGN